VGVVVAAIEGVADGAAVGVAAAANEGTVLLLGSLCASSYLATANLNGGGSSVLSKWLFSANTFVNFDDVLGPKPADDNGSLDEPTSDNDAAVESGVTGENGTDLATMNAVSDTPYFSCSAPSSSMME
jgi:hypothetical protein